MAPRRAEAELPGASMVAIQPPSEATLAQPFRDTRLTEWAEQGPDLVK